MIGQTEFCITGQCTKHMYGVCIIIIIVHMPEHSTSDFLPAKNLTNSETECAVTPAIRKEQSLVLMFPDF